MKYRKYRSRYNSLESIIRHEHLSIKKHSARKDEILIQDTTTLRQWGGLRKCWKGYQIAKGEADKKKMNYYAKAIRKFRQELKTPVLEFPQFGLLGRKMPQEFYCPDSSSCAQTQNGLEDYRLQELADPFRIEREPDLRKEQEEYFRRIRQGFVEPGSNKSYQSINFVN